MHTVKIVTIGLALLVACLLVGRFLNQANPGAGMAAGARVFLPLWFLGAAINMYIGVSRAGYSVKEELPVFAVVFLVPAAVAAYLVSRR